MITLLVAGALANKPLNGGEAWVRLAWALGFQRLGLNVHFVEQLAADHCADAGGRHAPPQTSANLAWFKRIVRHFGLQDKATLLLDDGTTLAGPSREALSEAASYAAALFNVSGHLTDPDLLDKIRRKVYVDVDPGFTQLWAAAGDGNLAGHDDFLTVGTNIGTPGCSIPTLGLHWRPVLPPVLLDQWTPTDSAEAPLRFTTVARWRSAFGPIEHEGRRLGLKVHEFRKLLELPSRVPVTCELALDIDAADQGDLEALRANGWAVVDPRAVSKDPLAFRDYVRGSSGELSAAQGVYVDTRSGWFSDRTAHYLAAGRPAVVQDTGLRGELAPGRGLVTFKTLEGAIDALTGIASDYDAHRAAAREFAERHLDSDRVLANVLDQLGIK
ncbi:MAG: hypothetical protein H0V26_03270 [Solirubrobacterales bacterium]|nr:hypothetical protein [Solirubrobacterales bacterium]